MNQVFDRIIRNGMVVLPDGTYKLDIGIVGGKIAAISDTLADSALLMMWLMQKVNMSCRA